VIQLTKVGALDYAEQNIRVPRRVLDQPRQRRP
jgi:hypothetical protein